MESGHPIAASTETYFRHSYDADHEEMRRLYEQAKRDQWNASRDVDWTTPMPDDGRLIADDLVDIYGTRYWDALSEPDRVELNRRSAASRLTLLVHGEHGAMLVCSQLVECLKSHDQKLFQATQVVDEARHNEVLDRYIATRLGSAYPISSVTRELFDTILGDPRWYVKTIVLQLVAETFAVSLFKMLAETSTDPLLRDICRRILQDEARHMGFGMLSLPEVVAEASERERNELEDITVWALVRTLTGTFPRTVYEEMGYSKADINTIRELRRTRAAGGMEDLFRRTFRRDLHTALVRNLVRIGLLTPRVGPQLESLGINVAAVAA
jgi:P-aminobenzoate N-oxygenase AurF